VADDEAEAGDAEAEDAVDDELEAAMPVSALPSAEDLVALDVVDDLRRRWHDAQVRFVDDPVAAAAEARALAEEAASALMAALQEQRDALAASVDTVGDNTEELRQAMKRYRALFEAALPD
jgi:hypothetical protein